ncbi:MAG: hypothetical protein HND53_13785 [Proteobacteria bacterium]|nr:hypothetical protein [Pseudomonadota bacterium]NOG61568.1 hypothetical protein [Pseudomonadota bacterium]
MNRILYSFIISLLAFSLNVNAEDALMDALTGGKVDFSFRMRYEHVDDKSKRSDLQEADATTARTTLGYKTGDFHNVFGYLQFENVTDITDGNQYNSGRNGLTAKPTIADPDGTEVNQAYLGLKFIDNTLVKVGRQILTPREAPFHRYLGTVLWRQNWQTQDAVTVTNTTFKDTELMAGYIWNNNTIFGTDRDMKAPIFNVKYNGFQYAKLEGYYYDLEFDDAAALSTETIGIRANGAYPMSETTKLIYAAEFADQSEGDNAPTAYDANYYLVEGGFKMKLNSFVTSLMAKASYEVLESDSGVIAFRTPLATGHAFQGWADNFLVTPTAGIEDTYFTMVATGKYDTKIIVSYHMLEAETGGFDYGDEIDVWFTKKFNKRYTVGLKYAAYDASSDVGNTKATDLSKFWAYFAFKF